MRVIDKTPSKKVVKEAVCQHCGVTIEYVPNDVVTLWEGTDMGGGPDGAKGFTCPECGKQVVTERW